MPVSCQQSLFEEPAALPPGLVYQPEFLSVDEERELLVEFAHLPFRAALFQRYTARRRVVRFGEGEYPIHYEDPGETANPRRPFPEFLLPYRRKVALWLGMDESAFADALCTEYQPGTPIGWHSDAPYFEAIVGISLAGKARMRFRPYAAKAEKVAALAIELEPRSAYLMRADIRWRWQHHIPPTKELRYSITFRTLRGDSTTQRPPR